MYIPQNLEFNEAFKKALHLIEFENENIFITGKAGTGKSTLLNYFRETTKKKIVVLAPTGVAALNVQGQTIHSFFGFKPGITYDKIKKKRYGKNSKKNIYKNIDTIVIDEISMVRADLLDYVDRFMRLNGISPDVAFGGVQMVFIGDLYQLPPIVNSAEQEMFKALYASPYFFEANVFKHFPMQFIELEKVYRQKDAHFIDILNAVRNNTITQESLKLLNERFQPSFEPEPHEFTIHLTTTNQQAKTINERHLDKLKGRVFSCRGHIEGDFDISAPPTHTELSLKKDAQIMMLNNDPSGRWVNGSIGKIIDIVSEEGEKDTLVVMLNNKAVVEVTPFTWELFKYMYDEKSEALRSETIGSFTQYPLTLAWAVTIHKSQGKTFEKVILDIGNGTFAHGQMYVALSRCTSLEGLILRQPVQKRHILMDWRIVNFVTQFQYHISEKKFPIEKKIDLIQEAIVQKRKLEIVYLKASDEKSKRIITPSYVGEMTYSGKKYIGVAGFDAALQEERNFRVDRILEISGAIIYEENAG
jgi:ATP-dependent DNA helicase PIF1